MAKQTINLGAASTGIGGDSWRAAFVKCNDNFTDLYSVKLDATANAVSASKLATARTINGTSFDGSGNITTANWGTSRNLTIGNSAKAVNGSANVAWTVAEIGAVALGNSYADAYDNVVEYIGSTGLPYESIDVIPNGRMLISAANQATNKPNCGGDSFLYIESKNTYQKTNPAGRTQTAIGYANGITEVRSVGSSGVWTPWKRYAFTTDDITGNSATATKFSSARVLSIGNTSKTYDGTASATWTLNEIGALPDTGGTVTGKITSVNAGSSWLRGLKGETAAISLTPASSGNYHPWVQQLANNGNAYGIGVLNNTFYISTMAASTIAAAGNTAVHLMNATADVVIFTPPVTATGGVTGNLTGNADTATKLASKVNINGVAFDGSANITLPTFTKTVSGTVPAPTGSTSTRYLREDGSWVVPTNTTYSTISAAEINAGTATATRLITPALLKQAIETWTTKTDDALVYMPIAYPKAIPPEGYLTLMGQTITAAMYPKLFAMYGPVLPDMRAYSIRGLDAGRGIDLDRAVLSSQEDAIRNITATFGTAIGSELGIYEAGSATGAVAPNDLIQGNFRDVRTLKTGTYDQSAFPRSYKLDASTVVPTAAENRVKNIAFLYIVKAG